MFGQGEEGKIQRRGKKKKDACVCVEGRKKTKHGRAKKNKWNFHLQLQTKSLASTSVVVRDNQREGLTKHIYS